MLILNTGITGHIGSRLARALARTHQVYGLVRETAHMTYLTDLKSELTLLPYDNSYHSMQQALSVSRPDLLYHLAAYYTSAHGPDDTPQFLQPMLSWEDIY